MSLSGTAVFEVRTTGSDVNGGGFDPSCSGTDYSQRDTKRSVANGDSVDLSTTDAVANGTTTITSASASFTSALVGNIIYFQGGSGSLAAGWYQVATFVSSSSITVDRSIAAGTGITMNIGGALASLGAVGAAQALTSSSSQTVWVKAGTYTVTSASTNVSGGCYNRGESIAILGYNTTRGDAPTGTNRPLIQAGGGISGFNLILITTSPHTLAHLRLDGANLSNGTGVLEAGIGYWYNVAFDNFTNQGGRSNGNIVASRCLATSCGNGFVGANVAIWLDCGTSSCTVAGFNGGQLALRCFAINNGGAFTTGFNVITACENCVSYASGGNGFNGCAKMVNCIGVGNGTDGSGSGAAFGTTTQTIGLWNCADYNNRSGRGGGSSAQLGDNNPIVLTGDPFTNAAGLDFSLNSTAGAGSACRAAGFPGLALIGGTGYLDVGVLQHQDSGGGGGGGGMGATSIPGLSFIH